MFLTIRLDELLRESVATATRDLVTRPTGAAVRHRIRAAMAAAPHPTARLDFSEVGLLDFSCADEIVAQLLREPDDHYVVLWELDEAHAEAVDHVLARQQLAVVAVVRGAGPVLLGAVSPELTQAFRAVVEGGGGDASRLARRLAWTPERAADALQSLALRRLVMAAQGTFSPLPIQ